MQKSDSQIRDLRPVLIFLSGEMLAAPIPLEREVVILGRALEADIRINDTKISRRHACLNTVSNPETGATEYVLTNLSSRNGTLLNGQPVVSETLRNGDKIIIGDYILRFEMLDEVDREYQMQIRRLLSHDDLTGLLSSRSFFSELRREAARAKEEKRCFCVLMMDIDFFKSVNDTYGHLTGSKTIEEIGACITGNLRAGDVAARFGGDEFAAFLLDAELGQSLIAAERFRSEIEKTAFTFIRQGKPSGSHHITASIGIACFPNDSRDPIELVEMADSALYRAKHEGRNRVCAYKDLEPGKAQICPPSRRS